MTSKTRRQRLLESLIAYRARLSTLDPTMTVISRRNGKSVEVSIADEVDYITQKIEVLYVKQE